MTSICQHFESVTTLSELGLSFVITNNPNTITPLFGLQMLCCGQLNKNDLLTMCGNIFLEAIGLQNFYHFTAHICSWIGLRGGQVHCLKPSKVLFKVTAPHCLQHLPKAVVPAQLMACIHYSYHFLTGCLANTFQLHIALRQSLVSHNCNTVILLIFSCMGKIVCTLNKGCQEVTKTSELLKVCQMLAKNWTGSIW